MQDFIQSLAGQDEVDALGLVKLIEERGNQLDTARTYKTAVEAQAKRVNR